MPRSTFLARLSLVLRPGWLALLLSYSLITPRGGIVGILATALCAQQDGLCTGGGLAVLG